MAEESSPPSPSFAGIDFNPSFFPGTASDFVEYPTAQGTVTFGNIFATDIDTPTPSVDFDLLTSELGNINFGTSVPTTKTIKIGASTGTSIHCGSIDMQGTNINNAVASGTGTLSLAPSQTSGILNIGTGSRTIGGSGGGINIGTACTGAIPITIGTTGQSTTTLNGTSVAVTTKMTTPAIDSTSAATNMTIGSNLVGGTLTIGGSSLNTGTISIGAGQTTGALNIGNGARTGTGAINIGTQATGTIAINIGTTAQTTTSLKGTSVDVVTKLTSPAVEPTSVSTALALAATQTSGVLNIGTGARTTGANINIGTACAATNSVEIDIGTPTTSFTRLFGSNIGIETKMTAPIIDSPLAATNMTLGGNLTSGNLTIGLAQTDGIINIGTGTARTVTGDINIGTGSTTANTVTIGSTASHTVLNGTSVQATTKLTTPILDCVTDATAGNTSLSIGPSAVNGNILIGAALGVGDITIGGAQITGGTITLGATNTVTTLNGTSVKATTKLITPILDCVADVGSGSTALSIGPSVATGNIVIGAALGIGDVSIGAAQSVGGTITLGATDTVTTLNGTSVKATTKLITPILDCVADVGSGSTALSIGPSVATGNIIIGAALGIGDVSIGAAQSAGGTITLGSASTASTINGSLSTGNNFLLSGVSSTSNSIISGKISVEVNQGSKTITLANYNNEVVFINTGTGGGGGIITLPPVATALGYTFTFRSVQLTATTEIIKAASDSNCILTTGAKAYDTASSVGTVTMTSGSTRTFISDGSFWVQV